MKIITKKTKGMSLQRPKPVCAASERHYIAAGREVQVPWDKEQGSSLLENFRGQTACDMHVNVHITQIIIVCVSITSPCSLNRVVRPL